ncbi:MAG: class I SAM-dependent methyltransferase, partial [Elusimicrobiota bacterium]
MDTNNSLPGLIDQALGRREAFIAGLRSEGTDCYRIFHGIAEGRPGLTVDRYGPLLLAQTFREPLASEEAAELEAGLRGKSSEPGWFVYNHRGEGAPAAFERWHKPSAEALGEVQCREGGVRFLIRARHRGLDPWLFLDLRAGRRALRAAAAGRSVLNLFAYTCAAGVCAAAAGAASVWNVDFAASSLEVGRRNAELNGIPRDRFQTIEEDCIPVMRQFAGLAAGGRRGQKNKFQHFEPRSFDLVFLDPPGWAKGRFGAVDIARDYGSLFKPAVLAAKPGGRVW